MLNITPIANNIIIDVDFNADLNKNQYVWRGLESGFQDSEIFFYDGTKTIQISNNQTDEDYAPKLDNGQIVWYQYNGSDGEIFFYDGTKTIQLTDNTANDDSPEIHNGKILWYQYQSIPDTELSQSEIFFYDGTKTIQITDNDTDEYNAQFYGNQIVWEGIDTVDKGGDTEILLYNNGQTLKLTDNQTYDSIKTIEENYIIWTSFNKITFQDKLFLYNGVTTIQLTSNGYDYYFDTDGKNVVWLDNNEVFLYDGNTTQQITNNGGNKYNVQVSGNKIVWISYDNLSGYDSEVFLYDGSTTTQLTNNNVSESNIFIDSENIVWQVDNFNYSTYTANNDIYIYRNGAVSTLANSPKNEKIISLSGNKLVGAIDNTYGYYRTVDQVFIATWTDDTFPILDNPDQYGASYSDLIDEYGYNLEAFNQHYRQFGIAENRSIDLFDEFEYLASNPKLIEVFGTNGKEATRHYIENGYKEKRPLNTFQADQYIASYEDLIYYYGGYDYYSGYKEPDLEGATFHYVEFGYIGGREADKFDELSYLAANSDLIEEFGFDLKAATKHYIQHGFYESYYRPLTFDATSYLAANTDVIDKLGSDRAVATKHYIEHGYNEDRLRSGNFDSLQYLASYKDVYDEYGVDSQAAINHFVDYGHKEGREKDIFDEYRYLASNPTLIPIYSYYSPYYSYVNTYGATIDYLYNGIPNNLPTTTFDPAAYLQANPDVATAYNGDLTKASYHYVQFGYFENRETV
ncbi:hypothetical protein C7H19_01600 [Aphanothece hegewaldii CCALA 016]|uniref:Bulb-type lectin domain-containing protein n=1 Tax=Aphanothece hegewaldii CCALA 016 TaxID=2107694 RepID=A0A2T1M429_9CHRO|nr:hypothetical protein [Aphanothece hegewaldii]PSF39510.1 hypothetical protein C7H19_01600 [Aphanothece hegewaldii CCALA 016]